MYLLLKGFWPQRKTELPIIIAVKSTCDGVGHRELSRDRAVWDASVFCVLGKNPILSCIRAGDGGQQLEN